MRGKVQFIAACAVAALIVGGCSSSSDSDDSSAADVSAADVAEEASTVVAAAPSVYANVLSAGTVKCGTRDALPGFAVLQDDGTHVGFDSDFCRVIAAAMFGDANAVEMVDVATADRFTALQSGAIDVLVRNTTWTASRDGGEGATFVQTNFYDGQGMMVETGKYNSIAEMKDAIVCVAKGTTTEGNAALESSRRGLNWEVRAFDDTDLLLEGFIAGQCDGWSSDTSQLTGFRSVYPSGPEALTILPEVFSKEPLGPAVLDGDSKWAQVVRWAILATIAAEEFGITSANVDDIRATTEDVSIKRFLGVEIVTDGVGVILDPGLGLPTDFAYQIVKQVGNYGEIFERHLAPLGLKRGVNALWTDGGLMYSPPYR